MEKIFIEAIKKVTLTNVMMLFFTIVIFMMFWRGCFPAEEISRKTNYTEFEAEFLISDYENQNNFKFTEWRKSELINEIVNNGVYSGIFEANKNQQIKSGK